MRIPAARATARHGVDARLAAAAPSQPPPHQKKRRGASEEALRGPAETTARQAAIDYSEPLVISPAASPPLLTTTKRAALLQLLAVATTTASSGLAFPLAVRAATSSSSPPPSSPSAPPACLPGVRFDLAAAILRSAYAGFDAAAAAVATPAATSGSSSSSGTSSTPMPTSGAAARLKVSLAELRRREYRYYLFEGPTREGERAGPGYVAPPPPSRYADDVAPLLAALEEEESGDGVPAASNNVTTVPPPIFDFAVWSLFKAIAAELPPSQAVGGARSVMNAECGRALARAVGGDLLEAVRRQRSRGSSGSTPATAAPFADVAAAFQTAMDRLAEGGYCCAWQVTYGDQPGSWPSDWTTSEPKINGDAREGAARTLEVGEPLPLQLRVSRPRDVGASVALRNEEWGFCARLVPGVFAAFLEAGGYGAVVSATVSGSTPAVVDAGDVFYAQDAAMARPSSLRERLLLALGDPLVEVIVSFTPETEIADWLVVVPLQAGGGGGGGGRVVAV